jgi:hypothetical protein
VTAPPEFPLYPEPQPLGAGRYVLAPAFYGSLPRKFWCVNAAGLHGEVVVVQSSGALRVVPLEDYELHEGLDRSHEKHEARSEVGLYAERYAIPRVQGMGRRWSHIPWTEEMKKSCRPWKVTVRLWSEAPNVASVGTGSAIHTGVDI